MNTVRTKRWRWPIPPETVRAVLSSHSVLGLAFAAMIYLVCLTGTIAVFAPDLQRLELPATPVAKDLSVPAAAYALGEAARHAPADASLYLTMPGPAREGATLVAFKPDFERNWAVAENGTLSPLDAIWTEFLIYLHICLHLPRSWGGFIVGLTGVALLSSLVSGILAHPRIVRDAFHLRLGGSRRLQDADMHNRLGVWALPFHFTLALTGALLGLSTLIVAGLSLLLYRGDMTRVYALFLDPPPAVDARTVPMPDLAALIAQARGRMAASASGGVAIDSVMVERPGRGDMRISVHGREERHLVPQHEVQFDARGSVLHEEHPKDLAVGTRVLSGIGQLHFGWYGGLAVRIAYGLLGLALCVVTSSGVTIWLARRRDRGRPAPRWERVWPAVCWGQPVILALTALVPLALPDAPLTAIWFSLGMVAPAVAAADRRWSATQHARAWKMVLVVLLAVLVLVYGGRALFIAA